MTASAPEAYIPVSEQQLEEAIQSLKLTAPRILPRELADLIEHVEYVEHTTKGGKLVRWCIFSLKGGGHAIVGEPNITFSPENDRPEFGRKLAYEKTFDAMWPLMAFKKAMDTKTAVDMIEQSKDQIQQELVFTMPKHAAPIHATDLNHVGTAADPSVIRV